jgi:hypothetical protein
MFIFIFLFYLFPILPVMVPTEIDAPTPIEYQNPTEHVTHCNNNKG